MTEITVPELRQRLAQGDHLFLLDVRQPEEHAESHIDGAVLIPLSELPERFEELSQEQEIVVFCRSGNRSARAVAFLMAQGFSKVSNLVGGNNAWQAQAPH